MEDDKSGDNPASGSAATQFKVGNSAWRARSSHGRNPIFKTPDDLWNACCEYFEWNEDNPLQSVELVKFQGAATQAVVPKMRAMSIVGLCNFLDIGRATWGDYKARSDFSDTVTRAEEVIYQQKLEGAAAELLNPNFIGKEIGLVDKQSVETTFPQAADFFKKKSNADSDNR